MISFPKKAEGKLITRLATILFMVVLPSIAIADKPYFASDVFSQLEEYAGYDKDAEIRRLLACDKVEIQNCVKEAQDSNNNTYFIADQNDNNDIFDINKYTGFAEIHFTNGDIKRGYFIDGNPDGALFTKKSNIRMLQQNSELGEDNGIKIINNKDNNISAGLFHNGKAYGFFKTIFADKEKNQYEFFFNNGEPLGASIGISDAGMSINRSDKTTFLIIEDSFRQLCVLDECNGDNWGHVNRLNDYTRDAFNRRTLAERKKIQTAWASLNYYRSVIDGQWGHRTLKASLAFATIYGDDFIPNNVQEAEKLIDKALSADPEELAFKIGQDRNRNYHSFESSGTGYFISADGFIVSNKHVVENCRKITTEIDGEEVDLALSYISEELDLAVLSSERASRFHLTLKNHDNDLLTDVIVAGYPLSGALNSKLNVTRGIISGASGMGGDDNEFQIDAAIQPGNSGSPVLGPSYNVIGTVSYKFNQLKALMDTGAIPENIAFAIKSNAILLDFNNHWKSYSSMTRSPNSLFDEVGVGQLIKEAVVSIRCTS